MFIAKKRFGATLFLPLQPFLFSFRLKLYNRSIEQNITFIMGKINRSITILEEKVISKIYLVRNRKVMLDFDLAEMYAVETKQLKRQVKRNTERFPKDFMFTLTKKEFENLRSQIGTSSWGGSYQRKHSNNKSVW